MYRGMKPDSSPSLGTQKQIKIIQRLDRGEHKSDTSGHKHSQGFSEMTSVVQITLRPDKWEFTKLKTFLCGKKVNSEEVAYKMGGNVGQPYASYMTLISKSTWNKREGGEA